MYAYAVCPKTLQGLYTFYLFVCAAARFHTNTASYLA